MKRIDDYKIYLPSVEYHFSPRDLLNFLNELGVYTDLGEPHTQDDVEDVLTVAHKYSSYKYPNTQKKAKAPKDAKRLTKSEFREKIVRAPFLYPSGEYHYLRIRIAPSSIAKAGMGAYALDLIPKGAKDFYVGVVANEKNVNSYYSWTINAYNKTTGKEKKETNILFYIDCEDPQVGNWTRYVNCGTKSKNNNFDVQQIFDKIIYYANKDILPGEELFIDYGEDYRTDNLKMKGKY
jgi:hypothetical protein